MGEGGRKKGNLNTLKIEIIKIMLKYWSKNSKGMMLHSLSPVYSELRGRKESLYLFPQPLS